MTKSTLSLILSLFGLFSGAFLLWCFFFDLPPSFKSFGAGSFSCTSNTGCYFSLPAHEFNYLELESAFKGFGYLGYGYWSGTTPIIISSFPVHGFGNIIQHIPFSLDNHLVGKKLFLSFTIPEPLLLRISTPDLGVRLAYLSFSQKISQSLRDFFSSSSEYRVFDVFYYSGKYLSGISLVTWGYSIFLFVALLLLLFFGWSKAKYQIFVVGVSIFIIIGVSDLVDHGSVLNRGLHTYSFGSDKRFFDLGDEYAVLSKAAFRMKSQFLDKDCSLLIEVQDSIYAEYLRPLLGTCKVGFIPENLYFIAYKKQYKYMLANSRSAFSGFSPRILEQVGNSYLVQNR